MRSFVVILSLGGTNFVRSVWFSTYAIRKARGFIMRAISSEVPYIYGIGSHSYFLFAGCWRCFCLVHLHMNSVA